MVQFLNKFLQFVSIFIYCGPIPGENKSTSFNVANPNEAVELALYISQYILYDFSLGILIECNVFVRV